MTGNDITAVVVAGILLFLVMLGGILWGRDRRTNGEAKSK